LFCPAPEPEPDPARLVRGKSTPRPVFQATYRATPPPARRNLPQLSRKSSANPPQSRAILRPTSAARTGRSGRAGASPRKLLQGSRLFSRPFMHFPNKAGKDRLSFMICTMPPALQQGDMIGVMAPSSRISRAELDAGKAALEERGYKVALHPQCHETLHQSAGTHQQKLAALHELAGDPAVKAVIFATGGNRALHLLDGIDYDLIAANPKIYMGFSDCTALLNAITARAGLVTYHGPVLKRIPSNPQLDDTLALLAGAAKSISLSGAASLNGPHEQAAGLLAGGNLSLIRAMQPRDLPPLDGAVLFLEDVAEEYSKLDRDLCALRRSGMLDNLSALIFGGFTDMTDTGSVPFGFSFAEIVRENTQGLSIPILTGAPFGHDKALLRTFPIGAQVRLEADRLHIL